LLFFNFEHTIKKTVEIPTDVFFWGVRTS